jgi:replicative DNA helicase
MIVVAARPGMGKALGLDTPLPTPTGWTTMGEVKVGDYLIDADGRPTRVVAATDIMVGRPCHEVEFSDGTVLIADAEHQWLTDTPASRKSAVRTTRQIAETLRLNHSVGNTKPMQAADRDLLVPPYTLGAWLGDATNTDPEIVMRVEAEGIEGAALEATRIPAEHLRASETQRRALLAGLLDTNGAVTNDGTVQFSTTNDQLAEDVFELVVGLGYGCRREEGFTLSFCTDDVVFHLPRKALLHKERRVCGTPRVASRFITDVRPIASVPVRCVEVDNGDHLYLAGRAMIPTHNSTLGLDFLRSCSIKNRLPSILFSLEMSKSEIVMRLLSAEAKIKLADMRSGRMTDDDWTRLARRMSEISEAPMYIDDSPNLTMMEIRAKARRLHQKAGLRLIVLDYLQLMTSGKKVESRQQEVSEFSRQIKLLAKELEVPVVAMSQLNRGPEQRTDKKPMLADLRESGSIEQDADMVILLHRPDAFETDDPRGGEADLIVAKHRAGPTRTVTVAHQLHLSRFTNMAR